MHVTVGACCWGWVVVPRAGWQMQAAAPSVAQQACAVRASLPSDSDWLALSPVPITCLPHFVQPFQYADVVTTTTHKSLRGPRAGMIFFRRVRLSSPI